MDIVGGRRDGEGFIFTLRPFSMFSCLVGGWDTVDYIVGLSVCIGK